MLDQDEMTQVQARSQRRPLSRRLNLSGPADDFQRREIKRLMEDIREWARPHGLRAPSEAAQ